MRVLILHNIVNPQVLPYFELLAREPLIDVTVWFLAERASTRLWDTRVAGRFQWEIIPGWQWEIQMEEAIALQCNPSLAWRIPQGRFDVVVLFAGWDSPSFWLAAAVCKLWRIPMVVRSGSVPGDSAFADRRRRTAIWRRRLTRRLVRSMIRGAASCICYGSRSRKYLIELGGIPDRVFSVWNTIDVERLSAAREQMRARRAEIRARLGIAVNEVLVLYVGRFQPVKNLPSLIDAYRLLWPRREQAVLGLAGYGPCEPHLRVRTAGLAKVHYFGAVDPRRLAECYTAADIFALPSADIWGLVVNEAMAFGLPVVAADSAGCTDDLILPGVNGFVYPASDSQALAQILERLVTDRDLRQRLGRASAEHIQNFTYKTAAPGFIAAVKAAARAREETPAMTPKLIS